MKHKLIAAVERLSGRTVLTFVSDHHVGPDLEIELFMLVPRGDAGAGDWLIDRSAVRGRASHASPCVIT